MVTEPLGDSRESFFFLFRKFERGSRKCEESKIVPIRITFGEFCGSLIIVNRDHLRVLLREQLQPFFRMYVIS